MAKARQDVASATKVKNPTRVAVWAIRLHCGCFIKRPVKTRRNFLGMHREDDAPGWVYHECSSNRNPARM